MLQVLAPETERQAATQGAPRAPVALRGLAEAHAPHALPQTDVLEAARRILAPRFPNFERFAPTFLGAGVEMRQSVVPFEWFEEQKDWPERSAAYEAGALDLWRRAAGAAMEAAGWRPQDVDAVVTVSSTGITTPTLEARAAGAMGFRSDLRRVPVFGLGCAGGVSGLSIASELAAARPGARVLFVTVECCTLSFRLDRLQKADMIATVLFGDGAAAACLEAGTGEVTLGTGTEHTWPDSLDIMGWRVEEHGLGVIFDRSIPEFAEGRFREATDGALERMGLRMEDVDRFTAHPGGAKVVDALESALDLTPGTLGHERDVLRDHGNMSAPTALFVLNRALKAGTTGRLVLQALGPGFTASFLPIEVT